MTAREASYSQQDSQNESVVSFRRQISTSSDALDAAKHSRQPYMVKTDDALHQCQVTLVLPGLARHRKLRWLDAKPDLIHVRFEDRALSVSVEVGRGGESPGCLGHFVKRILPSQELIDYEFAVRRLPGIIVPAKSHYKAKKDRLVLYLQKAVKKSWHADLNYSGLETADSDQFNSLDRDEDGPKPDNTDIAYATGKLSLDKTGIPSPDLDKTTDTYFENDENEISASNLDKTADRSGRSLDLDTTCDSSAMDKSVDADLTQNSADGDLTQDSTQTAMNCTTESDSGLA